MPRRRYPARSCDTPGHTPESISVLVYEHAGDQTPYGVLTGDALFIGDVGRPDLLASIGVSADELGHLLYESVQHKLMGLPDAVRVFPAHGAGSACGKNLSTELHSTIGQQRAFNYACQPMSESDFVALVTAGQPSAPDYFLYDAFLNRMDHALHDADQSIAPLGSVALSEVLAAGAVVVDARDPQEFAAGHLAGAVNVPADGRFAETAGMVLGPEDQVVVVAEPGQEREIATRLARIGFDHVAGYLADVEEHLVQHPGEAARASRLASPELSRLATGGGGPVVLDVRNAAEREAGFIPGSLFIPLAELRRRIEEVPVDRPVVAYCASGWRSSVAASLLRRSGHPDASDLLGGFAAWEAMRQPVSV